MNKNKKLVSLVCVIAMMFTMLSSFTFASAADKPALVIKNVKANDTATEITLTIGYEGMAAGLAGGGFQMTLPSDVKSVEEVDAKQGNPTLNLEQLPTVTYVFSNGTKPSTDAEGDITTLKITLNKALKAEAEIKLNDTYSYISDPNRVRYVMGAQTNALEPVSFKIPSDPFAKPVTTKEPGAVEEEPTPDPNKPVIGPEVKPEAGNPGIIISKPTVNDDGTEYTFTIGYQGMTAGLAGGGFQITLPSDVKSVEEVDAKQGNPTLNLEQLPIVTYVFSNGTKPSTATEGDITTIKVTFNSPLADDVQIKLNDTYSYISDPNRVRYVVGAATNSIPATNFILEAAGGADKPNRPYVIPMSKAVGDLDLSDDDAAANAGESKYWIDITVKKDDDTAAVYDTDYIATVEVNGEEVELTKAQFNNAVNGHLGKLPANLGITKMSDVAEKVKIKMNTNGKVSAPVIRNRADAATGEEKGTILNADVGEVTAGSTQQTQPPADAKVGVTAAKSRITTDGFTTVKATVTHPDAKLGTAGTDVTFEIQSGADYLGFDEGANTTVTLAADNTASIRVNAKKAGTATVKATYNYTNKAGETVPKSGTVKITVYTPGEGGGDNSGSDKKQSGTSIAPGNSNLGGISNGIIGTFSDIDSVDWAKEAITLLSLKGIVSGRGDGTFAPNDNITRAEYCQILIGAINKTNEYADSAFADVPSDAWFYHAVSVASENGIVSGYGDGNFGPYDLITRQDMALMTYKAAQVMNKNLSSVRTMSFADAGSISEYAATAVQTLADAAIINGVSDTEFAPRANATRAQAAKILYDTFVKQN